MCRTSQRDIEYLRAVGCSDRCIAARVGISSPTLVKYAEGTVKRPLIVIERELRRVAVAEARRVKKLTAEYEAFVGENSK